MHTCMHALTLYEWAFPSHTEKKQISIYCIFCKGNVLVLNGADRLLQTPGFHHAWNHASARPGWRDGRAFDCLTVPNVSSLC